MLPIPIKYTFDDIKQFTKCLVFILSYTLCIIYWIRIFKKVKTAIWALASLTIKNCHKKLMKSTKQSLSCLSISNRPSEMLYAKKKKKNFFKIFAKFAAKSLSKGNI